MISCIRCVTPNKCANFGCCPGTWPAEKQTKAQRLAKQLGANCPVSGPVSEEAAAELRRLDASEAALLEALDWCVAEINRNSPSSANARTIITRIEAERNEK